MKTYFMIFHVRPTSLNIAASGNGNSLAHLWVVDKSSENALATAKLYLSIYNWDVIELEKAPTETTVDHFSHSRIGLQCFQRAQNDMLAVFFLPLPGNGKQHQGSSLEL